MSHQAILPSFCLLCTYLLNRPSNIMCVWPVCLCECASVCIPGMVLDSGLKSDNGSVVSGSATSWTTACQAPLSMRFSKQEYCSGLPFLSPGDPPNPGIDPGSSALQADSLPSESPGKPLGYSMGKERCRGDVAGDDEGPSFISSPAWQEFGLRCQPPGILSPPQGEVCLHKDHMGSRHHRDAQAGPSSVQNTEEAAHPFLHPSDLSASQNPHLNIKICVYAQSLQLCVSTKTVACQTPLSMGFSRQENWNGLSCPPPGDLPDSGIKPMPLMSPALAGGFFTTGTAWKAQK